MASRAGFSYKAGEKGKNRVRVYQDPKAGVIFLEWYETTQGRAKRKRVSLGHSDRERAKTQADEAAARFRTVSEPIAGEVTLAELFSRYLRLVTPQKGESKRQHDHRAAALFLQCFGGSRKVSSLNKRDWERFQADRRVGRLSPPKARAGRPVGSRQIAYDLKFLRSVIRWAVSETDPRGRPLLERPVLQDLKIPEEANPRRPVLVEEQYRAMLEVADRVDWRFHVALVVAHETGHRINAVRLLRWEDVNFASSIIRWRAQNDKIGLEHFTPLTPETVDVLRMASSKNVSQEWILPSPGDPDSACDRHIFRKWWRRAERLAGLTHEKRVGWHSLRRKFASELKEIPLKDLCQLGGWKSAATVLMCYQQPDEATMRRALEGRKRLGAAGVS